GKRAAWACGEKMGALQPGTRPLRYTTLFRSRSAVVSWSGLRAAGVGRRACGDAIVGKNFLGVLTQAWGGAAQTPRCGRQLVRRARHAQGLAAAAFHIDKIAAVRALRVGGNIAGVANRRDRDAPLAALGMQFRLGTVKGTRSEHVLEDALGFVGGQESLVVPAGVAELFGARQAFIDQPFRGDAPEAVAADAAGHQVDIAVLAAEGARAGQALGAGVALADRAFQVVGLNGVRPAHP